LRQVALDLQFKQQKQENDILTAWYKASNTFRQIGGFRNQTNNFLTLLEGEQEKFFLGQSSLFLVNAREVKYIKSRLDFIDAIFKFEQAKEQLRFELFSRGEGVITPNAQ
jgi:outer membrane protein